MSSWHRCMGLRMRCAHATQIGVGILRLRGDLGLPSRGDSPKHLPPSRGIWILSCTLLQPLRTKVPFLSLPSPLSPLSVLALCLF
jgi:hypothetical protein